MKANERAEAPPIPARLWALSAVTGAGAFMAMLDSTVANLAIESVRADFGATLALIQWIATGYLIALAVSLPATGWLGARLGYGRLWGWSLGVFVAASVLCALAPNPPALIAARLAQGLAAGLMVPAGQAVIGATAAPRQLGRIMGVLGLVIALGPALGPALGGYLLDIASWRWLFWINVPVGLAALFAARGLVPRGERDRARTLDWRGLVLLGLGLPLFLYGATGIGASGRGFASALAVVVGLCFVAAFALGALRVERPLVNLRLLKEPTFAAATATAGLTGANMYGGLLLLPLFLQRGAGQDAKGAGLMLLAMGLGSALVLPVAGMLTDRRGPGIVSMAGAGLLFVSLLAFVLPVGLSMTLIAFLMVVRGVGQALAQMPAMTAAYASVLPAQMGDASTLVNIAQRIGGALGAIGIVIVLALAGGEGDDTAYPWAFAALIAVSLASILTAAMLRRADIGAHAERVRR